MEAGGGRRPPPGQEAGAWQGQEAGGRGRRQGQEAGLPVPLWMVAISL